jgi:hypothetical protein
MRWISSHPRVSQKIRMPCRGAVGMQGIGARWGLEMGRTPKMIKNGYFTGKNDENPVDFGYKTGELE